MAVDQRLLDILVCPESHEPLLYIEEGDFLFAPGSRRKYRIEDDVPVMLLDESEVLDEAEAARVASLAKSGPES